MLPESLMFWSVKEFEVLDGDGSKTVVFFLFSSFLKLLDDHRARMNNRTGKAEAKLVLAGNEVI